MCCNGVFWLFLPTHHLHTLYTHTTRQIHTSVHTTCTVQHTKKHRKFYYTIFCQVFSPHILTHIQVLCYLQHKHAHATPTYTIPNTRIKHTYIRANHAPPRQSLAIQT